MPIPTSRLLAIALAGTIAVILIGSRTTGIGIALIWAAAVLIIAAVDALFVRAPDGVSWRRDVDQHLSLGAWNTAMVVLENRSARSLTFQVRAALPPLFLSRGESSAGTCPPGSTWSSEIRVFPLHRGSYSLIPISVRYLGPLGLVWWQRRMDQEQSVQVYPNLLAVRQYEVLLARGRIEEIGLRNSKQWGSGTEFERLRDYTADDEYRRIDWKATARRNSPVTIDYELERSQNVILALDVGRLMSTRLPLPSEDAQHVIPHGTSLALTRLDYAVNASVLLAFVSQQYGDRVGILAFSDRVVRYVSPKPGRRQFVAITDAVHDLEVEPTEPAYAAGAAYLTARNTRRSLVVLFTDIAEQETADFLAAAAIHLSRRHLPLVVTLKDPGVERMAREIPTTPDAVYERAVARVLLNTREGTLSRLRSHGVLTLDVTADELSSSVINAYMRVKARSRL